MNQFNTDCHNAHNKYRELHQVAPLAYSADLHKQAQAWAERLAAQDKLEHSPNSAGNFGENVAMKYMSVEFDYTGQQVTDQWYSEIGMYDFNGPENQIKCGHFSQVVWRNSKEAGFGVAKAKSGKMYAVGQYRPPGNYMNQWHENVLPTRDGKVVVPTEDDIMGRPEAGGSSRADFDSGGANAECKEDRMVSRSTRTRVENDIKTVTIIETYEKPSGEKYDITITQTENTKDGTKGAETRSAPKAVVEEELASGTAREPDHLDRFRQEVVDAHNMYRVKHRVKNLQLNAELNQTAQDWANYLAKSNKFQHSKNTYQGNSLGENIAAKWSSQEAWFPGEVMVKQWYDEEPLYTYDTNPTTLKAGHFTQVVWQDSRELGVGCAADNSGKVILVCNYYPAGNVIGRFPDNVKTPTN